MMRKRSLKLIISLMVIHVAVFAQRPANDECTGATAITLTPFASACSGTIMANTQGATKSSPNPSCTFSLNDDDIWYGFQATTKSIVLCVINATYNGTGQTAQIGFSFYEAACPATTNNIICSNLITAGEGYLIIPNLVPGTVYYLRFWSASSTQSASFEFCVQEAGQPVNDECINATPIISQPIGTICNNTYNATTVGAMRTMPDPNCTAHNDDDIWYSFTANTNAIRLHFSNAKIANKVSGFANLGFAIYESSCPSTGTEISCNPNIGGGSGSELIGGLTAGKTYYLRLFSYGTNIYITFDFCVVDETIVANDECADAINLPVTNGFCISPIAGDLSSATTSPGFGSPACTPLSSSEDVWFKATVPASGNLIVQTSAVITNINELVMEAYSGSCGALTFITCDDNGNPDPGPSDLHPRISLSGRIDSEIIYFRVLGKGPINKGPFAICAWDPSVLPAVSPGGNCIDAIQVTINAANKNLYMWVPVFDNMGNIIAEIYGDGNALDEINTSVYTNTSGTVRDVTGKYYLDRNISIRPTNNQPAKVRLYFTDDEFSALKAVDPTVILVSDLNISKTDSVCQQAFHGSSAAIVPDAFAMYGTDHYVEFSTASFSEFFINSNSVVLPLQFISFVAHEKNGFAALSWKVKKDHLLSDFTIENSIDGVNFKAVGFVSKNEFIHQENDAWAYEYVDDKSLAGKIFYRIRMNDLNGRSIYSGFITINLFHNGSRIISVYPNPAANNIFLKQGNSRHHLSITLHNISGQPLKYFGEFYSQELIELNLSGLKNGMYILRIEDRENKEIFYKKITKM